MFRLAPILIAVAAMAQTPPPAAVISPEVDADKRVTFRLRAPNAVEVILSREGAQRQPMTKDEKGVWSHTTASLEPDFYGYSFVVDGVSLIDPGNPLMKPNLLGTTSMVHVPGPSTLPWEVNTVPRGTLNRHFYRSGVVGDHRDFYVYTPPGYDGRAKKVYPVLYLLHGFSDDASGWTSVGRAHVILDNLIAQGKAKPMLVVMTLGYGAPEIVSRVQPGMRDPALRERNMSKFRESLLSEVIPAVDKEYRTVKNKSHRAIAGLSMGGAESLYTGLNSLDTFTWIGAFSSGGLGDDYQKTFPNLDAKAAANLQLLWIACGKDDRLIESNRKFNDFLKSKQIRFEFTETAGAHTWLVWRRYLADFVPLLFREKAS